MNTAFYNHSIHPALEVELHIVPPANGATFPQKPPRIPLTVIRNSEGWATKHFNLNADGSLRRKSHAQIWEGTATRFAVDGVQGLIDLADNLEPEEAFLFGLTEPESCRISTQKALKNGETNAISRDREHCAFREGVPGFLMLDHDPRPGHKRYTSEELDAILCRHIEGVADTERAWRPSSTAFLYREEDGAEIIGVGGWRCYLAVDNAAAIPAIGACIYQKLWAAGYGYINISASGQMLDKCLFDASVWQPERLDFAATPVLGPGIVRRTPEAKVIEAREPMLASERFTSTPTMREWRRQSPELKAAKEAAKPEAIIVRGKFVKAKLAELKESGAPIKNAEAIYTAAIVQKELYGDFRLTTPDGKFVTVAEVLADPDRFHEARFADPLEPDYANDKRIAYVNLRAEKPYLYSHIHGGMLYRLYKESLSNDCNGSASANQSGDANDQDPSGATLHTSETTPPPDPKAVVEYLAKLRIEKPLTWRPMLKIEAQILGCRVPELEDEVDKKVAEWNAAEKEAAPEKRFDDLADIDFKDDWTPPSGHFRTAACYEATKRGLYWLKEKGDETERQKLTSFSAWIVAERVVDDGVERRTLFDIEAEIKGRPVRFSVASNQFSNMNWALEHIGPEAIVEPGFGARDRARTAI